MSAALWTGELAITGVGMVTPVGLRADATAAALRAGVSRLEELDDYEFDRPPDDTDEPIGARVPIVTEGLAGVERLGVLAALALEEALTHASAQTGAEVRVLCGVPVSPWAGRLVDDLADLVPALAQRADRLGVRASVELVSCGRAAALQAARLACASAAPGGPLFVAGGVDCWSDVLGVRELDDQGRLRSGIKGSGVLPGEAAAFVTIEPTRAAGGRAVPPLATVRAAAGSHEPTPIDQPTRAVPLSELLFAVDVRDPRPLVVCDLNGERHRVFEWMFAQARALNYQGNLREWTPAEGVGDAGAAMGGVCLGWAALALCKGYARAQEVLVWGASDEGAREALVLQPAAGVA